VTGDIQEHARPLARPRRWTRPQQEHMGTERRGQVGEAEDQEVPHVAWPMSSSMPPGQSATT
jgi:hypothetical protein